MLLGILARLSLSRVMSSVTRLMSSRGMWES